LLLLLPFCGYHSELQISQTNTLSAASES